MQKLQTDRKIDIKELDTAVGIKLFVNIMKAWQVKPKEARVLLGDVARSTYNQWQKQKQPKLSKDTISRISNIIGIVKSLRILFGNSPRADMWVKKPNKKLNGKTALEVMLGGEIKDITYIKAILDTARG